MRVDFHSHHPNASQLNLKTLRANLFSISHLIVLPSRMRSRNLSLSLVHVKSFIFCLICRMSPSLATGEQIPPTAATNQSTPTTQSTPNWKKVPVPPK